MTYIFSLAPSSVSRNAVVVKLSSSYRFCDAFIILPSSSHTCRQALVLMRLPCHRRHCVVRQPFLRIHHHTIVVIHSITLSVHRHYFTIAFPLSLCRRHHTTFVDPSTSFLVRPAITNALSPFDLEYAVVFMPSPSLRRRDTDAIINRLSYRCRHAAFILRSSSFSLVLLVVVLPSSSHHRLHLIAIIAPS